MRCKADGAQEMRHIIQIGEFSSTTQRSRSLAQTIIQRFPKCYRSLSLNSFTKAIKSTVTYNHMVIDGKGISYLLAYWKFVARSYLNGFSRGFLNKINKG